MDRVDIQPATLDQVRRSSAGTLVGIEGDVANIAQDLRAIDRRLRLEYDVDEEFYVVYRQVDEDTTDLVTTSTTCDPRLVRRVQALYAPGYDMAAEMDRVEAEHDRRHEHEASERRGPVLEQLAHALRQDLGAKPRIFVPGD